MVGCAITAVQQLDLCEQAMQWMKPGNQFLNFLAHVIIAMYSGSKC
jgi:hypothetical protein